MNAFLVTVQSSSTLLVCRRRQHFVGYCADVNTLLGSVQTSSTLCWLLCRRRQHFFGYCADVQGHRVHRGTDGSGWRHLSHQTHRSVATGLWPCWGRRPEPRAGIPACLHHGQFTQYLFCSVLFWFWSITVHSWLHWEYPLAYSPPLPTHSSFVVSAFLFFFMVCVCVCEWALCVWMGFVLSGSTWHCGSILVIEFCCWMGVTVMKNWWTNTNRHSLRFLLGGSYA